MNHMSDESDDMLPETKGSEPQNGSPKGGKRGDSEQQSSPHTVTLFMKCWAGMAQSLSVDL